MEHHGLFTDISNSFPGNGVLPNTNVKYHHLPQIPPQPPPTQASTGQAGNPQFFLPQQQQHQQQPIVGYGHQQQPQPQQAQGQHVESDPIGSGLYHDTAGLFDATSALCTNNNGSNYSNVSNGNNVNNSKSIEFTSRKFETNTGDSITYNINNINTNIVNNISGGSLGANGVQRLNPAQAAITGGPGTDLLGNTQFSTTGGNAQISFNKDGDTNPTIINISNNNHNIMAPPYPYPYQAKISGIGALNDLNTKFGTAHGWSGNGSSHSGIGELAHETNVITNFEAKNPNKYHSSRSSYRYQQDFVQPSQQPQPTAHYQHNYGLYHPEGAQATPIQQPNGHHGYEPYPHIVRSKYSMMDEANRYGRSHQVHSASQSQSHHDLMYNERSRYPNNFTSGYMPPTGGYYATAQPNNKSVLNPSVDYFNTSYLKQVQPINAHQASHYLPNRSGYPHQNPALSNYHHQNYTLNQNPTYEDLYHHRSRHHTLSHHFNDGHHGQQAYANYPSHAANLGYPPNQKLSFSKSINDFYSQNVPTNPTHHYPNTLSNPPTSTVHHTPHYGIKYTSHTIVPPMNPPKPTVHPIPTSQPSQKPSNSCYYDTPNPIIDMNHPLIDLEEQINSVKILKGNRDAATYDANHALNYDCQQKYLMNRYLHSKTSSSSSVSASTDGYVPNGAHTNHSANLASYGYSTMDEFVMGSRSFTLDENLKDKNLRDYLSSWNETEEEDSSSSATGVDKKETNNNQPAHQNFESCKYLQQALEEQLPPLHSGVIVANVQNGTGNLPDILNDLEKTKEDPPKVGQETTEVGEKLYILETYDVPHSELNKYKHLSVINELPKNVVPIHDSADSLKFLEEIESNRDKYYQTELESEVVYEERKKDEEKKLEQSMPTIVLDDDEPASPKEESKDNGIEQEAKAKVSETVVRVVEKEKHSQQEKGNGVEKGESMRKDEDSFKVPEYIPKYRKRRHFDNYDYPRFPKRARRSSIEDFLHSETKVPKVKVQPKFNPKLLFGLCVAALNSREYRRYAKADMTRRKDLAERKAAEEAKVEQVETVTDVSAQDEKMQDEEPSEVASMDCEIQGRVEGCEKQGEEEQSTESADQEVQEAVCVEKFEEEEPATENTRDLVEKESPKEEIFLSKSSEDAVEDESGDEKKCEEEVNDSKSIVTAVKYELEDEKTVEEENTGCEIIDDDVEHVAVDAKPAEEEAPGIEIVDDVVKHVFVDEKPTEEEAPGSEITDDVEGHVSVEEKVVDIREKHQEHSEENVTAEDEIVSEAKDCIEVVHENVSEAEESPFVDDSKQETGNITVIQVDDSNTNDDNDDDVFEKASEAEKSPFADDSKQENGKVAVIQVEDSNTNDDDDDDVFEKASVDQILTMECERVSVIVDDSKQVKMETVEIDEDTSKETVDDSPALAREGQRVPVIQKTDLYESMELEEPVPCFNPPSLQELTNAAFECYRVLYDYQRVPPLRILCYEYLLANDLLPEPQSLQKLCEQFICNNRQLFIIEEVQNEPPRLQELCQKVVNETNIIIDVNDLCILNGEELVEQEKEDQGRVFIVQEDHGSIEDLLRENEDDVVVVSDEVSDEHEIFFGRADCSGDVRVVLESSHSLSDSENEIYRKVEREIERMMTTSSDEEDEATKRSDQRLDEDALDNEFFSFVGDDECIQYEEVVPVNKEAYRRESLIRDLREKYMIPKGRALTCRLKLLRKYVYYLRFIRTKDGGMQSKQRFFSRKLNCLRRKIAAMRRSAVVDVDSDSNSSSASSASSSSSSSSSSASSSSGSASENSSDSEEAVAETGMVERSSGSLSEESSNQSTSSSVGERLIETNNNQLDLSTLTKPANVESQPFAKEEDNSSNSSDSRSRGFSRRSTNISPLVKKKKLSFEESLLSIEQMYKKTNSPTQSTGSPNTSNSSSPAVRTRLSAANCGPSVVVNVNNNREAPRKLFIPSYKIFNQALAITTPFDNGSSRPTRPPISRRSSSGSSSSSSNGARSKLANGTQRSRGLIRVNYPNKPSPTSRVTDAATNGTAIATRSHALPPALDRRIPFVRLERIDYVEKLAENYRKQQQQQQQQRQQQQFAKQRQRRKSTFS